MLTHNGGAGARADVLPCQAHETRRFAIAVEDVTKQ